MGRWFFVLLIGGISLTLQARDAETFLQWENTGYSLAALFAEEDFSEFVCQTDERAFAGCLSALNSLLRYPESNAQQLQWNEETQQLSIVEFVRPQAPVLMSEALRQQEDEIHGWMNLFASKEKVAFTELFAQVRTVAETTVPAQEQAYAAASAFNEFLQIAYDPHAAILPASSMNPQPNNYFGIGAYISLYEPGESYPELNGSIALKPMKSSPAENAGLKKGDLILAVNGESLLGQGTAKARELLLGPAGTQVTVTIHSVCDNQVKEVSVTRGPVTVFPDWKKDSYFVSRTQMGAQDPLEQICEEPVPFELASGPETGGGSSLSEQGASAGEVVAKDEALYVPLTSFSQSSSLGGLCSQFQELQQRDLENPRSRGIILDLRGNPGGRLDAVSCMLNTLILDTRPMIGQVQVRRGQVSENAGIQFTSHFSEVHALSRPVQVGNADGTSVFLPQLYTYNREIVVLVDDSSASASEIFAGVIQDMGRGWVIGDRTYGKGSVQTVVRHFNPELSIAATDQVSFKTTTAIYTLPSGRSPQQTGIVPEFRFNNIGEPIADGEDFRVGESRRFGSIVYNQDLQFELPRQGELATVGNCAMASDSLSSQFKNKAAQDERYRRPFVANYQLQLATDVLSCSPDRPDTL